MMKEFAVNILLLVEDSEDDILITQRKVFKSSLKIGEFIVAKSLTEAIEVVKNKQVDVVLLDLNLPETRGIDTIFEFRKVYDGIIIVCTSLEDEMTGIEAIRRGADDYLVKSQMNEFNLTRAVLYARERRRAKLHVQSIKEKLEILDKLVGV
jgi:two-component system, cell cycle response regulator